MSTDQSFEDSTVLRIIGRESGGSGTQHRTRVSGKSCDSSEQAGIELRVSGLRTAAKENEHGDP